MAAKAAKPLAGAIVGAAKLSDSVVVSDSSVGAESSVPVVLGAEVVVGEALVLVSLSSSSEGVGGSASPQSASIWLVQASWPEASPVFSLMHWLYSCSQMKVGMVWR